MSDRRDQAASSTPETLNTAPDSPDADTRRGAWGFGNVPRFWGPRLRILLVMDGRINVPWGDHDFGLGYVLKSLRERFAWWVSIEITTAHRFDVEPVEVVELARLDKGRPEPCRLSVHSGWIRHRRLRPGLVLRR